MASFTNQRLRSFMSPPSGFMATVTGLALLALFAARAKAQCFTPNGTDINKASGGKDYQPCYASSNSKQASMCCATNRGTPDTCRSDGLCLIGDKLSIYRESCTDPTWRSPSCVKLCTGTISKDLPSGDEVVTVCPAVGDQPPTYCCGSVSVGTDCCRKNQGLYLLPDGTTSNVNPSGGGSTNGKAGSTMDSAAPGGNGSNKARTAALSGGIFGAIALISLLAVAAYFLYRRRQRNRFSHHDRRDRYHTIAPEMRGPARKHSLTPTSIWSDDSSVAGLTRHKETSLSKRNGSYDSTSSTANSSPVEVSPTNYSIREMQAPSLHQMPRRPQPAHHELDTDHVRHMLSLGRPHSRLGATSTKHKTPRIEVTEVPRSIPAFSSNETQSLKAGLGTREALVEIGTRSVRDSNDSAVAASHVSGSLTSLKKTLDWIGAENNRHRKRSSHLLSPTSPSGTGSGWKRRSTVCSDGGIDRRRSSSLASGGGSRSRGRSRTNTKLMLDKPVPAPPLPPPASRPPRSRLQTGRSAWGER